MTKPLQSSEYVAIWGNRREPPLDLLKKLSETTKFAVHQVEMTLWLVDTLEVISSTPLENATICLKGGTCVQHYIPYEKQRFSQDIDLAVISSDQWQEKIAKVDNYLGALNGLLAKRGWKNGHGLIRRANPTETKDFPFIRPTGRVFEAQKWPRRRSQLFGKSDEDNVAFVKVEFFLHEGAPDFRKETLDFEITKNLNQVSMDIATIDRLAADKIIAMADSYNGRQEFKDVLDYDSLKATGRLNKEAVANFIVNWAKAHLDNQGKNDPIDPPVKVLGAALRDVEEQSDASPERLATTMGNMYARGRAGYVTEITQWKQTCKSVSDSIGEIAKLPQFSQS